jgi:anaerobic ribonucleoside-triphosphate reductase activating protein
MDLFFYGCHRHCPGCHNLKLQKFMKPNSSALDVIKVIRKHANYHIYVLSLMGGEPLEVDINLLSNLIKEVKGEFPDIKVALFTGYELEDVPEQLKDMIDYIKTGWYDERQKAPYKSFLATKNQKMWKKVENTFVLQYPEGNM